MGCFSYMCKECGKAIYSDKYDTCVGIETRLARIVKGELQEWMAGRYDSYGRVHVGDNSQHFMLKDGEMLEVLGETETHEWMSETWSNIVTEKFNHDITTGIVAVHEECWNKELGYGEIQSDNDPNQGWCDPDNPEEEDEE